MSHLGGGLGEDPGQRWRDYVSRLAWERLGVPPEELEEVSGVREVWASLLRLLPPRPSPRIKLTLHWAWAYFATVTTTSAANQEGGTQRMREPGTDVGRMGGGWRGMNECGNVEPVQGSPARLAPR
ncbi:hypothetical protein L3Q82_009337, partial [Scortum barcoo]